ncbi:MAG TPA: PLP-dependent aspartate aminotransferase family protein [Candidatus Limnocylindrales bacterium]|nr:PLP-dependent aspartate aminotransferase family protein [Candidatus Limnocylindrales bacterium]
MLAGPMYAGRGRMNQATRVVHAGSELHVVNDLTAPIHQSSVYYARTVAEAILLEDPRSVISSYSRTANPTTVRFEQAMAELEAGDLAVATPSGMAALTLTFLTLLGPADRVVASPHSYADTVALLEELAQRVGFELIILDLSAPDVGEELIRRKVTFAVVESPSNPMLRVVDIAGISRTLRSLRATLVVDSTMATPINQQPLTLGADVVIHSATKYLTGHHNAVAGIVVGRSDLLERMRFLRTITGMCLDPHSAWLVLQGIQTLSIRVRAQNDTAQRVAEFLLDHPQTDFVAYPGLATTPTSATAAKQMSGYGGVVTFGLRGDLATFLESLSLCTLAVSLGGTKTLIEAPRLMSHVQAGLDNATLSVIPENAVRLSVGLESVRDIIADLTVGFAAAAKMRT